jgi:hypothetical protein
MQSKIFQFFVGFGMRNVVLLAAVVAGGYLHQKDLVQLDTRIVIALALGYFGGYMYNHYAKKEAQKELSDSNLAHQKELSDSQNQNNLLNERLVHQKELFASQNENNLLNEVRQ